MTAILRRFPIQSKLCSEPTFFFPFLSFLFLNFVKHTEHTETWHSRELAGYFAFFKKRFVWVMGNEVFTIGSGPVWLQRHISAKNVGCFIFFYY